MRLIIALIQILSLHSLEWPNLIPMILSNAPPGKLGQCFSESLKTWPAMLMEASVNRRAPTRARKESHLEKFKQSSRAQAIFFAASHRLIWDLMAKLNSETNGMRQAGSEFTCNSNQAILIFASEKEMASIFSLLRSLAIQNTG